MSGIRELRRADLPQVCRLYERVARSGTSQPPPQLQDYFVRTFLDHPWVDAELPSLVYDDGDGGIVGFLGSHPRRMRLDGRPVRMACSGQLVADPGTRHRGVGALLMRRYLAGPQDLTITDGATDHVRRMWGALGGQPVAHASIGWLKVIRPGATIRALRGDRGRRSLMYAARMVEPVIDKAFAPVLRRRPGFVPVEPAAVGEPLTPDVLVARIAEAARSTRFYVDYDVAFAEWLFRELDAVDAFGDPVRTLVRDAKGRIAGWYVYFLKPGGVAQVLQIAAPNGDIGLVLDHLLWHASAGGATAVRGRVEPTLIGELRERRCVLLGTEWALAHTKQQGVMAMLGSTASLLTRLDGEWWMGHHLLWRGGGPPERVPVRVPWSSASGGL